MKPYVRTYLVDDKGERSFGAGPAELLRRIREYGSLRAASQSMGMAYTKALALVKNAESALGHPLTRRVVGGAGGGGSTPTPEADALLDAYERWTSVVEATAAVHYASVFADLGDPSRDTSQDRRLTVGVAVLAAGHATRFGTNKLLEPLFGEPVLARTLGCVSRALPLVVASATPEVDELARGLGADVVVPGGPDQSDSTRALAAHAREAGWDACLFVPGDQPLIEPTSVRSLTSVFSADPGACVRLSWRGRVGSPILFPAQVLPRLESLTGDVGGRAALGDGVPCKSVEATWPWELWDIDTHSDLERIREVVEAGLGRA